MQITQQPRYQATFHVSLQDNRVTITMRRLTSRGVSDRRYHPRHSVWTIQGVLDHEQPIESAFDSHNTDMDMGDTDEDYSDIEAVYDCLEIARDYLIDRGYEPCKTNP